MSNSHVVLGDIGGTGVFALLAETFSARRRAAATAPARAAPAVDTVATPSGFTATLRLMPEAAAPGASAPAGPGGFTAALRMMPEVEAAPATPQLSAFPTATGFTAALRLMTEAEARSADSAILMSAPIAAEVPSEPKFSRAKVTLWTAGGYVGVAVVMASSAQLFQGAVNPMQAILAAIGGGIVAAIAWRRAWSVMANDATPSVLETPPYAVGDRPAARGNPVPFVVPFGAPRREDFARSLS